MRVVFHDCGYETFGVQYLLAVLRREGHEGLLFFDQSFNKDYLAQDFFLTDFFSLTPSQVADGILRLSPDAVCFSVYTLFYRENMRVIRLIKERRPGVAVICGGFHPTLLPEKTLANPGVDFAVLGEAEISLPILLAAIARHGVEGAKERGAEELPGVCTRRGGVFVARGFSPIPTDLDALPFPEKDAYYRENPALSSLYTIVASRGCPYRCTYCNSATMNETYRSHGATYYRVRSVQSVLAELRAAVEKYHPRHVMFFDDVFAARRGWLQEFSRRYRAEIGLPFYCQTSPLIHDAESLSLLAEAGCCLIEFGFQSADETVRREVLRRTETNEAMRGLIAAAIRLGIFTELDVIANLPGEVPEHLDKLLAFVTETRPHWVNLAFLQFHPKTPITQMALDAGQLAPADIERIEEGLQATSMRLLSKTNLGMTYRLLPFRIFCAFYLPPAVSRRLIRVAGWPVLRSVCSATASLFLYASRILLSYLDRRDFLIRHHVRRSLRALRWVLAKKPVLR